MRWLYVLQTAFVRGHRRTGSDVQFIERTRQDAQQSMGKELQKLILTAPTSQQDVSINKKKIRLKILKK